MVTYARVARRGPNFPESDGDPMPERPSHFTQIFYLRFALGRLLAPLPHIYIGGNHFVYYNPERQEDNVAPDVLVAFGVEERERERYQTWDEGDVFPQVIFEILSPKTRKEDLGPKRLLYARLDVQEYYVHDPRPHVSRRLFEGYHLVAGELTPMDRLAGGGVWSPLLGTELRVVGRWLRVIDPVTGLPLPTPEEETEGRLRAERQAEAAGRARRQAEERRWTAELAWRTAEERAADAEAAAADATVARQAAEERAASLEAEMASLRALLEARQHQESPGEEG